MAAAELYKVPEFASFGSVFRSSKPQALTESELEYLVHVTKHIFSDYVVFQYKIQNTVPEQRLDNVRVAMEPSDGEWEEVANLPAAHAKAGETATAYVAFKREGGFDDTTFAAELMFNMMDVDPDTGEPDGDPVEEDYPLEDVELPTAEYMAPVAVAGFRSEWEAMDAADEVMEQFSLPFTDVAAAAEAVTASLGMAACDGTGVVKDGAKNHSAYLSGQFLGGYKVLARMALALNADGCLLKIAVRADDPDVAAIVKNCIQ